MNLSFMYNVLTAIGLIIMVVYGITTYVKPITTKLLKIQLSFILSGILVYAFKIRLAALAADLGGNISNLIIILGLWLINLIIIIKTLIKRRN